MSQMHSIKKETFEQYEMKSANSTMSYLMIGLTILNTIVYIVMIIFNAGAATPILGNVFKYNTSAISAISETYLTPSGWTFSTWGIIYAWQALWLLFALLLIILKKDGFRLFNSPPVLSVWFHLFVLINFILNIVWLFVWDSLNFTGAYVVLVLMTAVLYVAAIISHKNTFEAEMNLMRSKWVLWGYRLLVNNGLAFYATWITAASNVNLSIAITYRWVVESDKEMYKSTSAIIALSVIAVVLIVYFILDIYVLEKYLRYTYSPYVQLAIALIGIITKSHADKEASEAAQIYAIVLLVIGPGVMFLTKVVSSIIRTCKGY